MFLLAVNQTLNNDELIKEMQDKVISLQDHEISFLNDTIANIWATVAIGVGIVVAIAGLVGWIIGRSNQKSERKMQLAEQVLGDALTAKAEFEQYKNDLEVYRDETRKEFEELTTLINSEEIENIKGRLFLLSTDKHIEISINQITKAIKISEESLEMINQFGESIDSEILGEFDKYKEKFKTLQLKASRSVYYYNDEDKVTALLNECLNFTDEVLKITSTIQNKAQEALRNVRESVKIVDDGEVNN